MIIALAITHDAGTIAPLNFWNFNGRSCHSLRFQVKRHLNTCVFRKCFPDLCEKRAGLRLDAVFFPSLYDANAEREILHLARVVENPPSAYVLGQGKTQRPPTQPLTLSIECCQRLHDYRRGFHPTGLNQKVKVHKKWDL